MVSAHNETGERRIAAAFAHALRQGRAALMPYFTLGYPERETSLDIVEAIAPLCDLMELGMPFSDPIADGPTIQRSTQRSLENGTTVSGCLAMLVELRQRGVETPAMLMGYYNPILAYGEERFARDAARAGADGLIVPDLPPEESEGLASAARRAGLAFIYFLAPTTDSERGGRIIAGATGFIYLISVTGVTGARNELGSDLPSFVRQVKGRTRVPVAVGFGISTPEQAAAVGKYADGVIIGSALVNAVEGKSDMVGVAREFVYRLGAALAASR
jgi:tryptophan synthase alpha chain